MVIECAVFVKLRKIGFRNRAAKLGGFGGFSLTVEFRGRSNQAVCQRGVDFIVRITLFAQLAKEKAYRFIAGNISPGVKDSLFDIVVFGLRQKIGQRRSRVVDLTHRKRVDHPNQRNAVKGRQRIDQRSVNRPAGNHFQSRSSVEIEKIVRKHRGQRWNCRVGTDNRETFAGQVLFEDILGGVSRLLDHLDQKRLVFGIPDRLLILRRDGGGGANESR